MPQNGLDLSPQYDWHAMDDMQGGAMNAMALPARRNPRHPLSKYLQVNIQGSGSPSRRVGDGVMANNYNVGGSAQANIPINHMMDDTTLNLRAGGHKYGGNVMFNDRLQGYGLPPKISYGDGVISNVGVGLQSGNHEFSADYDLQDKGSWPYLKYKYRF